MKRKVTTILVQDAQGTGGTMHYAVQSNGEIKKHLPEKTSVLHDNHEAIIIGIEFAQEKKTKALTGSQEHALFDKIVEISEKYHDAKVADTVCSSVRVKQWLANYTPILDLAA
jgi:hypothetical protein